MEMNQFIYITVKGHTCFGYLLLHNELLQNPEASNTTLLLICSWFWNVGRAWWGELISVLHGISWCGSLEAGGWNSKMTSLTQLAAAVCWLGAQLLAAGQGPQFSTRWPFHMARWGFSQGVQTSGMIAGFPHSLSTEVELLTLLKA